MSVSSSLGSWVQTTCSLRFTRVVSVLSKVNASVMKRGEQAATWCTSALFEELPLVVQPGREENLGFDVSVTVEYFPAQVVTSNSS